MSVPMKGPIVLDGPCEDCGANVHIELPANVPKLVRIVALKTEANGAYQCDACADEEVAEGELMEAARDERRRKNAGIPAAWVGWGFDQLDEDELRTRAVEMAVEWGANRLRGLVLWGPAGRGKTALAASAANAMMEHRPVRWLAVSALLLDLKMPFDSVEYKRATRRLLAGGDTALVLDDLDKLKPTEHAVQPLYVAINGWIEAQLPLLVTMNRGIGDLERWLPETFGEAIASRLAGYCAHREVGGRDRRVSP